MDQEAKKAVLRTFTYGLYALTVEAGEEAHGATVNWVMQSSFDPPMLAVSVEKTSRSLELIRRHGVFSINVFRSDQRALAGQLGRHHANEPGKFQGVAWERGPTGAPVLVETLGCVECRAVGEVDSGDSVVLVAEILEATLRGDGTPLTMAAAGFRHAG